MAASRSLARFLPDKFLLMLLATVALASFLPATGRVSDVLSSATTVAVSLLFFLHGARLTRSAVLSGLGHWRVHLMVVAATFIVFPLLGWALKPLSQQLLTPELQAGVLFLCALPSTVQSSIAFTAMARGNMPAAICAASASTLMGIVITPLLVGLLLSKTAAMGDPLTAVGNVALQLLLPFVVGHLLQPFIGGFLKRHPKLLTVVDRGSILLVVYVAFSHAVSAGLWSALPLPALGGLFIVCALLLGVVMGLLVFLTRRMGFSTEDEITIVFCGSKKSLVSGVPMANVLFPPQVAGAIVVPLMLFHQMQLMLCAFVAQRYARREQPAPVLAEPAPR